MTTRPVLLSTATTDQVAEATDGRVLRRQANRKTRRMQILYWNLVSSFGAGNTSSFEAKGFSRADRARAPSGDETSGKGHDSHHARSSDQGNRVDRVDSEQEAPQETSH